MAQEPFYGLVVAFAFSTPPTGWMPCRGQVMNATENSALASLLGNAFGGDPGTTFALPDLQGRAAMGQGTGSGLSPCAMGQKSGSDMGSIGVNNLAPHSHTINITSPCQLYASAEPGISPAPSAATPVLAALNDPSLTAINNFYSTDTAPGYPLNTGNTGASLSNSGDGQPFSLMKPYLAVNYCIAVSGNYPPRT